MIYIPTLPKNLDRFESRKDDVEAGMSSSFTLKYQIDPKKIIKKYDFYNFNPFMNEFSFVDENGFEYLVRIFKSDNINSEWVTVVNVFHRGYLAIQLHQINPEIMDFFYYLWDNFGEELSVDNGDSWIRPGKE